MYRSREKTDSDRHTVSSSHTSENVWEQKKKISALSKDASRPTYPTILGEKPLKVWFSECTARGRKLTRTDIQYQARTLQKMYGNKKKKFLLKAKMSASQSNPPCWVYTP